MNVYENIKNQKIEKTDTDKVMEEKANRVYQDTLSIINNIAQVQNEKYDISEQLTHLEHDLQIQNQQGILAHVSNLIFPNNQFCLQKALKICANLLKSGNENFFVLFVDKMQIWPRIFAIFWWNLTENNVDRDIELIFFQAYTNLSSVSKMDSNLVDSPSKIKIKEQCAPD